MNEQRSPSGAVARRLRANRWHFQHGPIDLIIGIDGRADAVQAALAGAFTIFSSILAGLVCRLPVLRRPMRAGDANDGGSQDAMSASGLADFPDDAAARVAARMLDACAPHASVFVTPMAAVAGSVADEMIEALRREPIERAFVNNGGDIALHLTDGAHWTFAIATGATRHGGAERWPASVRIDSDSAVRGLATSGWRGRSQSLGIADAVTVLATSSAQADVAATLIANAVDIDSPAVLRMPASDRAPGSDLGRLPVTVCVGPLTDGDIGRALRAGRGFASATVTAGLAIGARLLLAGHECRVGRFDGAGPADSTGVPILIGSQTDTDVPRPIQAPMT